MPLGVGEGDTATEKAPPLPSLEREEEEKEEAGEEGLAPPPAINKSPGAPISDRMERKMGVAAARAAARRAT